MSEVLVQLFMWSVDVVQQLGYAGVLVLMTLESTFVPIPSELVMPQAGYLAAIGKMNFWVALLMATIGSVLGAMINYIIAARLGRPLLLKYGKYFLFPPHKYAKMEAFFIVHGEISTFTGRLILGVRHFISFPAGLARMHIGKFCALTAFGAGLWAMVLEAIGYWVGNNPELVKAYAHKAALCAALACVLIVGTYIVLHRRRQRRAAGAAATDKRN